MERLKNVTIILLLVVGFLTSTAPAKNVSVLLQEGLYAEEIQGDLDAAIKIYEQVIDGAKEAQREAAQATYRIGMCYLKKGRKDKAAEHLQNIILNFTSQKALVAKAEKQLDKIKPQAQRIVERAVKTISTCAEGDPRITKALESLKGLDENVVVNELVKFLDLETDTVRRSAIYILWKGDLKDVSDAVPALEKLCSHKEEFTRGMAALALGQAKVYSSFDTLCDMTLKDNSGYARRCGAIALGWMGRADAKPILEKALKDSDRLVCINAKAALAMLPEKVRPPTRVFEPQALDEEIKSGKVPSFEVQLPDNTGLDLDSGEIAMLKDEWPDRFDVAWDNDGGGVLMKKAGSGIRFLALPSGEKQTWDNAIYIARSDIDELRNSNTRGIWASQGKFAAVLTSEGNLAVIQIGEYDENKGTIYGWVEKIPIGIRSFGPIMERLINDDGEEKNWLIDFDTGRLFSHSIEIPSEEKFLRWCAENRIDAMGETRASGPGLYGFDMASIPIATERWNTISPMELAKDLSIAKVGTPTFMSAMGDLPVAYIFKTREGGMGVVQILEMQDNKKPRHFRIRYKTLQKEHAKSPIDLSTPEATIKSFVKAVYDGKLKAAGACVSKDGHDYDEFKEMLATESNHPFQAMIKAMDASIPVEITSKDITEDRCKIKWYFTLGRVYYIGDGETKMKKGTPQEFSSYLELVGDKWLIRDI